MYHWKLSEREHEIMNNPKYKSIKVSPISGALGAMITGVKLKDHLKLDVQSFTTYVSYQVRQHD